MKTNKILSILLSAAMLISTAGIPVFADEAETVENAAYHERAVDYADLEQADSTSELMPEIYLPEGNELTEDLQLESEGDFPEEYIDDEIYLQSSDSDVELTSTETSGTCGDNLTWTLDSDGTLTISGTGEMTDWGYDTNVPWYSSRSSIKSVVIENGVTSIGKHAFYNCTGLNSVTIPDNVTSIGDYAFRYCSSLTSVTIANGVTSIGDYAFYGTGYYNDSSNWEDGVLYIDNCLIKADSDGIPTEYEIKSGTRVIADYVFKDCTGLTSVIIPNSVISIGNYAFYQCSGLTSITIPDSVISIGDYAFYRCSGLADITIGNRVANIGSEAFDNCTSLTSITIPDSVTNIGDYAFSHCSGLTSIEIPNGITTIVAGEFYRCSGLENITIPDSVTFIEHSAFLGCSSLAELTIPDHITCIDWYAFYGCSALSSVIIPNSVTKIGEYAFYDCISLDRVMIPDSVENIGDHAFNNTAYYNNENNWESDVLYISNCLIDAKTSISGLYKVKDETVCIAESAFSGCKSLTDIIITDKVTSIDKCVFYGCSCLISLIIPDGITSIVQAAFYGCSSLADVYYGSSEVEWNSINIGDYNNELTNATIHFNAIGTAPPTITYASFSISAAAPQISVSLADTEYDSTMITAFYKDGVLVDMQTTLVSANDVEKTVPVTDTDADTAKVMIWSSIDSMKPLCEPKTVDLTEVQ